MSVSWVCVSHKFDMFMNACQNAFHVQNVWPKKGLYVVRKDYNKQELDRKRLRQRNLSLYEQPTQVTFT